MKYLKLFEDYKQEELCKECDCKLSECKCDEAEKANEAKKAKPDFLDLDKDGNKKESMKKAAADKKKDSKSEKPAKLTAAQKKLPEGLRKAIEARKKK